MTLIIIHCNDFDSYNRGNLQSSYSIISFDESVYKPFRVMTGHINIMLVLQSCTDSLTVMAGSSGETSPLFSDGTYDVGNIKLEVHIDIKEETFPTSSDGTNDIGHIKVEEDIVMQEFEEVNVKTEKGIGSWEEECLDIKDEEGMYSEEEVVEGKDIHTQEEEDAQIKEEVSLRIQYKIV